MILNEEHQLNVFQDRAETFGLMTVEQDGDRLECEFRHLSLAEYMTALHVHITGADLKGFPRDRKELILQVCSLEQHFNDKSRFDLDCLSFIFIVTSTKQTIFFSN